MKTIYVVQFHCVSNEIVMFLCNTHWRPKREHNFPCPPSRLHIFQMEYLDFGAAGTHLHIFHMKY